MKQWSTISMTNVHFETDLKVRREKTVAQDYCLHLSDLFDLCLSSITCLNALRLQSFVQFRVILRGSYLNGPMKSMQKVSSSTSWRNINWVPNPGILLLIILLYFVHLPCCFNCLFLQQTTLQTDGRNFQGWLMIKIFVDFEPINITKSTTDPGIV